MTDVMTLIAVAGVGLFTTSAVMIGATIGLYAPLSRPILGAIMAFAAGVLVASLAIELGFHGAEKLHHHGFATSAAWSFVGAGFAAGSIVYYVASRYLDKRGAAIGSATRFRQYVLERRKEDIDLLAKCDLLRHLPPDAIDDLLGRVERLQLPAGTILFRAGDPGDALYIVASGKVLVLQPLAGNEDTADVVIAEVGEGGAFGEMALLSGAPRTASIRADVDTELLRINKADFDRLIATDPQLAASVERLSHSRAISNLAAGTADPERWAQVAHTNLDHVSRRDTDKMLAQAGRGAGLAIMMGDLLDTIPGLLVIGASFTSFASLSVTVMMGIFIGGIPESAASAALLRRAGFSVRAIYGLWSVTFVIGALAAVAGKMLIGDSASPVGVLAEAMAGGSLLALVAHAMMPEAFHQGGSFVVIPTMAGFLAALYLILGQSMI
jgi:CRP-like cAMP-binding protein